MKISARPFGRLPDGTGVTEYLIEDGEGRSVAIADRGCTIISITVPDRAGNPTDVVLGCDDISGYLAAPYFGATVGRYANRIGGGRFTLGGREYRLAGNDRGNCLHGGECGFDKKMFAVSERPGGVRFTYTSPDGEEGFPGTLRLDVDVSFSGGVLRMDYTLASDADTVASITNHSYFNLNGHGSGDVLGHEVFIAADAVCPADENLLAQAPPVPVDGTAYDFRTPKPLGRDIGDAALAAVGGYDHCYAVSAQPGGVYARVRGDVSGVTLVVRSDMPALQFYTGNGLDWRDGKGGKTYCSHGALCLECQQFPDAPNELRFPSAVVYAGKPGNCYIEYAFGV